MDIKGRYRKGEGRAGTFVRAEIETLTEALQFRPFAGTLNLHDVTHVESLPGRYMTDVGDEHCRGAMLRPCRIYGVLAAVIRPDVEGYPEHKTELLAPVHLGQLFDLKPGVEVRLQPRDDPWLSERKPARVGGLNGFSGVVFDLDGTLVDLDVPWEQVHEECVARFGEQLDRPLGEYDSNELLEWSIQQGRREELERLLNQYEKQGVETTRSRPLLSVLTELDVPLSVCTSNSTSVARDVLEKFHVLSRVRCIVGREPGRAVKPHPEPLEECLDRLDVDAGNSVLIGDAEVDARAAGRARASFLHVSQLESSVV